MVENAIEDALKILFLSCGQGTNSQNTSLPKERRVRDVRKTFQSRRNIRGRNLHVVECLDHTFAGLAQLVRALALQARGHWFESNIPHHRSLPTVLTNGGEVLAMQFLVNISHSTLNHPKVESIIKRAGRQVYYQINPLKCHNGRYGPVTATSLSVLTQTLNKSTPRPRYRLIGIANFPVINRCAVE